MRKRNRRGRQSAAFIGTLLLTLCVTATGARAEPAVKTTAAATKPRNAPATAPATTPATAPVVLKAAIPPPPAQARAEDLFKEIYKPFPPVAAADCRALAVKLLEEATSTKAQDDATRFTLLQHASDLAAGTGDADLAMMAAEALAKYFDVDQLETRLGTLRKLRGAVSTPEDRRDAAHLAVALIDDLITAQRYDAASQAATAAQSLSVGDEAITSMLRTRTAVVQWLSIQQRRLPTELETLKAQPDQPESNLMVGRYLCLGTGDWERGLAMLGKGADATLKALSVAERAAAPPPELADGWWRAAEREPTAAVKTLLRARARYWYIRALPGLNGLAKSVAEKRLLETQVYAVVSISNATSAIEGSAIANQIRWRYPSLFNDISALTLLTYHDAGEFSGGAKARVRKLEGAYSSFPVGGAGFGLMMQGVSDQWPRGRYLIVYRLQAPAKLTGTEVCFLDISSEGNTVAKYKPAASELEKGRWAAVPVTADLKNGAPLEYRLWPYNHDIVMDRVYVYRME